MKLTGDLKKRAETAQTKEEAKNAIQRAGMELTDDELDKVAGGGSEVRYCTCDSPNFGRDGAQLYCSNCRGRRRSYRDDLDSSQDYYTKLPL